MTVTPPLNPQEIAYLNAFANSRRMRRPEGPYYVDDRDDSYPAEKLVDYNTPPEGQPGPWCQWVPTEDGEAIVWDEGEKFYDAAEWMRYLIDHFIGSDPIAKRVDPERFAFLQGHVCTGTIDAAGEVADDRWQLVVVDNQVSVVTQTLVPQGADGTLEQPLYEALLALSEWNANMGRFDAPAWEQARAVLAQYQQARLGLDESDDEEDDDS